MWLQAKAGETQNDGITVKFSHGPDDNPKPGMGIGISGCNAVGLFENWITGETDYTIHALPSMDMLSYKWGFIVDDDIFEVTFNEFLAEFRKYETIDEN